MNSRIFIAIFILALVLLGCGEPYQPYIGSKQWFKDISAPADKANEAMKKWASICKAMDKLNADTFAEIARVQQRRDAGLITDDLATQEITRISNQSMGKLRKLAEEAKLAKQKMDQSFQAEEDFCQSMNAVNKDLRNFEQDLYKREMLDQMRQQNQTLKDIEDDMRYHHR